MNLQSKSLTHLDKMFIIIYNQINARALIGQSAMVYVPVNSWKNHPSSELLYKNNRP